MAQQSSYNFPIIKYFIIKAMQEQSIILCMALKIENKNKKTTKAKYYNYVISKNYIQKNCKITETANF